METVFAAINLKEGTLELEGPQEFVEKYLARYRWLLGIEAAKADRLVPDEKLGTELKFRRVARGLTLRQLSGISGVSTAHIARIERGERFPGSRILAKLEEALKGDELKDGR